MLFPELFFYLIGRQPNMSKKAVAFCECLACSVDGGRQRGMSKIASAFCECMTCSASRKENLLRNIQIHCIMLLGGGVRI